MKRILHVVGARPNFVKAASVMRALGEYPVHQVLVHTGQHYDEAMSKVFFEELGLPPPAVDLGVGSGSHARQTALIMLRLEEVVEACRPDVVMVYGDVNSTLAAALVCAKMVVPVGHVEAGLRSFDRTMPEEINRVLTDQVADLLFTPSGDADENLRREGVDPARVHLVGNVMIDTLVRALPRARKRWEDSWSARLRPGEFCLVTLHRPPNVDDPRSLAALMGALAKIAHHIPVVFPVHPRTKKALEAAGPRESEPGLVLMEPIPYVDFLALEAHAALVITDSGGVQEETTFLGVPCLTVRERTERPITVTMGTNTLVGNDVDLLWGHVELVLEGKGKAGRIPPLWDGRASERIARIVAG